MVDGGVEEGRLVHMWMDGACVRPLRQIKLFLGDGPDVTGGTIEEPVSQPEYVKLLVEMFHGRALDTMKVCFKPPYNNLELWKLAMCDYVWRACIDAQV